MTLHLRRHRGSSAAAVAPTPQELQITRGLERLRELIARDLMTPRVDVVALAAPVTLADLVQAVRRSGKSHFPVYEKDLDHLLGVLFVKDVFVALDPTPDEERASLDLTARRRDPYLVPESRPALELLADMRQRRRGFACVLDEYGGFSGVLTVNDLVSELVGDLHDEYDRAARPEIMRIDARRYLVDGSASIGDVTDETGAVIPDGEYATIGGFVLDRLGHIPEEGESTTYLDVTFRVARMERRRIAKLVVEPATAAPTGEEPDAPRP